MPFTKNSPVGVERYALELDGVSAGPVISASGGLAVSDVVEEKLVPGAPVKKHLGGVRYTDLKLDCGADMLLDASSPLPSWIEAFSRNQYVRKDGALVALDYNVQERSRLTFSHALIHEIGFPQLDAASHASASVSVTLSPEYTRFTTPATSAPNGAGKAMGAKSVSWTVSNFRLKIDGIDCTKVSQIEPIEVQAVLVDNPVGELRDYEKEPAHLEFSDLVVTLADSAAQTFYDWHQDFVVDGNNAEDKEKTGTLEFLDQSLKKTLITLSFSGLGIYKLSPVPVDPGMDAVRRVTAAMYCETITFATGPPAVITSDPTSSSTLETPTIISPSITPTAVAITGQYPDRFTRLRSTQ
jgi:hypothetical protein